MGGTNMGFTPTFDTLDSNKAISDHVLDLPRPVIDARATREILRFGGLSMDPITGATYFRGKAVLLAVEDRELLGVLLRRAGQIISVERLAAMLRTGAESVERQIEHLRSDLRAAGVSCLPCKADGLGYVLWRC
jgi:DNA-binding response OmpR family regulator